MRNLLLALVLGLSIFAGLSVQAHDNAPGLGGALQPTATGYLRDQQTGAFLSDQSVASAANVAVLVSTSTGVFSVQGRPNVNVSARFENASQTCTIRLARFSKDGTTYNFLGLSDAVTLTATAFTSGGHYVAPDSVFDTAGASHVAVVMVTGPTVNGVYLWLGSF